MHTNNFLRKSNYIILKEIRSMLFHIYHLQGGPAMNKEFIWNTFEKTGDLNTYLLFKEFDNPTSQILLDEEKDKEMAEAKS